MPLPQEDYQGTIPTQPPMQPPMQGTIPMQPPVLEGEMRGDTLVRPTSRLQRKVNRTRDMADRMVGVEEDQFLY